MKVIFVDCCANCPHFTAYLMNPLLIFMEEDPGKKRKSCHLTGETILDEEMIPEDCPLKDFKPTKGPTKMCTENCCSARDPKDGPCPNGCLDPRECLGDHGCECLAEKEAERIRKGEMNENKQI